MNLNYVQIMDMFADLFYCESECSQVVDYFTYFVTKLYTSDFFFQLHLKHVLNKSNIMPVFMTKQAKLLHVARI